LEEKVKLFFSLVVLSGLAFACDNPTPTPTPAPTPVSTNNVAVNTTVNTSNTNTNTANSTANSNSASNSMANSNQKQAQTQSQTATGGIATSNATGGTSNATGGNANAQGGGNGSNNTSNSTKVAASALSPPILPTVPCFKGAGAAAQVGMVGGSFGAGKIDQGCDDRELARSFSGPQTPASCKILINTKKAKKANITLEDCLNLQKPEPVKEELPVAPVITVPAPASMSQTIIVPAPAVTIVNQLPSPPEYRTEMTVHIPKEPVPSKSVHHTKPACQNSLALNCVCPKEK
jgi:hypothetical protein